MKNYVLFGLPGAGKGTQAALIAKKYDFVHISTGDLLRKEIANETEIGKKAKELIEKGNLVDDSMVFDILKNELVRSANAKGFIYDGFPRTLKQAEDLDVLLNNLNQKVDAVICLKLTEEVIIERIRKRAQIEGRADDASVEIIKQRIANYHTLTEPIREYYRNQQKYFTVDGNTTIEKGFADLCTIIDKY
jgi:adenylate kinase